MEKKNRERFSQRSGPYDLDSRSDFCFVAQSFQKRHNIGALFRCADAGMAREVVIVGRKGWKKKGAVGSTSCVPYKHIHNPRDAIAYLRGNGMSVVAIGKNDRSISLFDCVYPPKPAFVLGDKVHGMYQDFLEAADLIVEIPMYDIIQSLNIAVAGAVVMYDYLEKRSKEAQVKAGGKLMEKKNRETLLGQSGLHNLDSHSDFCFVEQSFQKQHNIDALFRCADAGMAREVVIVGRGAWKRRGDMGATSGVDYRHFRFPREAIVHLKSNRMSVVAVEKDDRSISLFDCVYLPKPAFVLGNEVNGVHRDFLEAADLIVEIPMYGIIQSLNVSVAGAVVMYDYLQKRSRKTES